MQKDSTGHIGFVFKENKITNIVKDSSAARNGVLIDHHLVEVNGQNVVGLKVNRVQRDVVDCIVNIMYVYKSKYTLCSRNNRTETEKNSWEGSRGRRGRV